MRKREYLKVARKPLDKKNNYKIVLNKSYEIRTHIGVIKSHILYH